MTTASTRTRRPQTIAFDSIGGRHGLERKPKATRLRVPPPLVEAGHPPHVYELATVFSAQTSLTSLLWGVGSGRP